MAQTLPSTQLTCPASTQPGNVGPNIPFADWFTGGVPSALNALVSPADSVSFPNSTTNANADFYRWSYRMFLWLTSPSPSTYGGTGLVMSSPEFYNLSPNAAGDFVMTRNPTNPFLSLGRARAIEMARTHPPAPIRLGLRVANLGPHNLPLVRDTQGNFLEVLPAKLSAAGNPLVMDSAGKEIELSRIAAGPDGHLKFLNKAGAEINTPLFQGHPRVLAGAGQKSLTPQQLEDQKFVFRVDQSNVRNINGTFGKPIFFRPTGAVIDTVVGDSEGNVQLTQAGSLIYYGISVNDVYAYYVTQINPLVSNNFSAQFPTTAAQVASIQSFATSKGHTLLDPNSLAMEIKTAWVDASTLPNPNDYVRMRAVVPTYNTTNAKSWVQNGTKTITAALVGVHVVGSVNGHPEMVWASFEHLGNTANVAYGFNDPAGHAQTQPADPVNSSTKWLFTGSTSPVSNGTTAEFAANASIASATNIVSNNANTIQGTNVLRLAPWARRITKRPIH